MKQDALVRAIPPLPQPTPKKKKITQICLRIGQRNLKNIGEGWSVSRTITGKEGIGFLYVNYWQDNWLEKYSKVHCYRKLEVNMKWGWVWNKAFFLGGGGGYGLSYAPYPQKKKSK